MHCGHYIHSGLTQQFSKELCSNKMRKAVKDIKLIMHLIFRESRMQSGLPGLRYVYIQLAAEL